MPGKDYTVIEPELCMFTVQTHANPSINGTLVELIGACDFTQSDAFSEQLEKINDSGVHNVVFDCTRLDFIASIGLGLLVNLKTNLAKRGGRLAMAGMSPEIHRGVTFTRLDDVFEVFDSVPLALAAFSTVQVPGGKPRSHT